MGDIFEEIFDEFSRSLYVDNALASTVRLQLASTLRAYLLSDPVTSLRLSLKKRKRKGYPNTHTYVCTHFANFLFRLIRIISQGYFHQGSSPLYDK